MSEAVSPPSAVFQPISDLVTEAIDVDSLVAELAPTTKREGPSEAALAECRQLAEQTGLPLLCLEDGFVTAVSDDGDARLPWVPADALAAIATRRLTAIAAPVPTAAGVQVAAVRLPGSAIAVAVTGAMAEPPIPPTAAIPPEAATAAAAIGWSPEQTAAWWRAIPRHAAGTPARLLTLGRSVIAAGAEKESLEWELESLADQIDSTYEEITLLHYLAQNLQKTDDTAELARLCLDRIGDSLHARGGAAFLQIGDDQTHFLTEGEVPFDEVGLARILGAYGSHPWPQPLVRNHIDQTGEVVCDGVESLVVVPVRAEHQTVGWLTCVNGRNGAEFGTVEASLLASIAVTLGTHVQNAAAVQQREEMLLSFVRSLVSSLDAKDPYTRGHSERVAAIGRALAVRLDCSEDEVEAIHLSGLLHDVGKIGIDDAVLCKPGGLTDDEFEQIKRHPTIGYQILGGIRSLAHILPGVRNHHESWDGTGYPDGLAGLDIPKQARILAVADSYDAMTSDRPYRNGMPLERLQAIFADGRGTQWDPEVIDAYFAIADEIVGLCEQWKADQQAPAA